MKKLIAFLQPYGITPSEAALRWVYYHSALQEKSLEKGCVLRLVIHNESIPDVV